VPTRKRESAFSLIETTAAIGIAVIIGFFLLATLRSALQWSTLLAQRNTENASLGAITDRLEADEDSAWSIFVPSNDVLGIPNGDGHEVDFFARDGLNRDYFWAYRFDNAARKVQRYLYEPGRKPVQLGSSFGGITAFTAKSYELTDLQRPSSAIYSPLYAAGTLRAASVPFDDPKASSLTGGNAIVGLRITTPANGREMQLSTQTAPSGFTIVLNYTPPPNAALQIDPSEIVFTQTSPTGASNGKCTGTYAYRNSGGRLLLDAGDARIGTDANGCFDGPQGVIALASQPHYTGSFRYEAGSCANSLLFGAFSPSRGVATAHLPLGLKAAPPQDNCSFTVHSDTGSQTVMVQLKPPCAFVGQSCTFDVQFPSDGPNCEPGPGGYINDGYDGNGMLRMTPVGLGTISPTIGSGTFTFTRTGPGVVHVAEMARYVRFTRTQLRCALSISFVRIGTFDIESQ